MTKNLQDVNARVTEIFATVDETAMVVLKGHLLIEEFLDEIIGNFVFHPEYLDSARLGFQQKLQLARSLSYKEHDNDMWGIAVRLNSLRNELAHSLKDKKREQKVAAVIEIYLKQASQSEHIALLKNQKEHIVLSFAISYFIGFLTSFKTEAEGFRKFIDHTQNAIN